MANMFKIVFKGDLEPLFLSVAEGMKLAEDLKNGNLEEFITIKGNTVSSSAIKAILPFIEDSKDDSTSQINKISVDFEAWKKRRLALSPEERAKSTSFMNFMSQAIRGRPLSEIEKKDVQFSQQVWFAEHPDFHTANPICYFSKEDISRIPHNFDPKKQISMREALAINALQFAERHINA